jgi:hypothetical protein
MRRCLPIAALAIVLSFNTPSSYGYGLLDLLGCRRGGHGCGCGCETGCACEPTCGYTEGCGCDIGCGCEPACGVGCGCGDCCGVDGRQFAGQKWQGCGPCAGPPICPCVGADGHCCQRGCCAPDGACGGCCEPGCGCASCCEPACGCGGGCVDACGCHDGGGSLCLKQCGFGTVIGCALGAVCKTFCHGGCCGDDCGGCSSELYWCEWHNDPPRCCDPCDRHGNWIGPGNYRAPYAHPHAPHIGGYAKGQNAAPAIAKAAAPQQPRQPIARQQKKQSLLQTVYQK